MVRRRRGGAGLGMGDVFGGMVSFDITVGGASVCVCVRVCVCVCVCVCVWVNKISYSNRSTPNHSS